MRYIDVPAKVLDGYLIQANGITSWPYDDGSGDAYWSGGASPKPYMWEVILDITPQRHSSHRTPVPFYFDAMDISVGDYIANQQTGMVVKIISVKEKTTSSIVCVVEDILRYNTFRDPTGAGNGMLPTPSGIVVFSVNESGYPILDPIPPSAGLGPDFYPNLMSRFQNFEQESNFLLEMDNHGFAVGDLVSADPETNTFVKSTPNYPFIIGTVTNASLGPNAFMVNPLQKIESSYPSLPGGVGEVLYVSEDQPGELTLDGSHPVLLKLRDSTVSVTKQRFTGISIVSGSSFTINGQMCVVNGTTTQAVADAINTISSTTGVTANIQSAPVTVNPTLSLFYGEPAFDQTGGGPAPSARINGVLVTFSTKTRGMSEYGAEYALEQDIAADINAANIPGITAVGTNNKVILSDSLGVGVVIENVSGDSNGTMFAGPASATGLPLNTGPSTDVTLLLEANSAMAIDVRDVNGQLMSDLGIFSVENGVKAAAMYIEQGIRTAATYVVADIIGRDAIKAMLGDQCHVIDKGNGEWAHYIYTIEGTWLKMADHDSATTDAQTVEVELDASSDGTGVIHTVSGGSRVTFVTVTVLEAFDSTEAAVTVGHNENGSSLMAENLSDLTQVGAYSTTPSMTFSDEDDVDIVYNFNISNSTFGKLKIAISYT